MHGAYTLESKAKCEICGKEYLSLFACPDKGHLEYIATLKEDARIMAEGMLEAHSKIPCGPVGNTCEACEIARKYIKEPK